MKILITGGAGFIGCNLITYLHINYPELEIHCVDKLTYAGINFNNIKDKCKFRHIDILRINQSGLDLDFDYIIHLAAETHVDNSIKSASPFLLTNVCGTYEMAKFAMTQKKLKMFIHMSTDECYGDSKNRGIFTEESLLIPSNPYAASKVGAEAILKSYERTFGLPLIILRPANNYGFFQNEEKFIPLMIKLMLKKKTMHVSEKLPKRDWVWAEDTARVFCLLMEKGRVGETYNLPGYDEHSIREIAQKINDLGRGFSNIKTDYFRPGEDERYLIDGKKIEALGYKPTGNILGLLPHIVDWYSWYYRSKK